MSTKKSGRSNFAVVRAAASSALIGVLISACGGGGGGSTSTPGSPPPPPPTQSFTIGGSISGLSGSGLVLQDNAGDNLTVAANSTTFTFSASVASGSAYAVTVLSSPASQTCTVTGGSGTVSSANVTNVAVTCTSTSKSNTYSIGGTVTGLVASGLVLQDNAGDNLTVAANSTKFTFSASVLSGSAYAVTVLNSPASQTCTVTKGSGTVSGANVTNIAVACTSNTYSVGGTVTGLAGSGLVLQDNRGNNLAVQAASGSPPVPFTFTGRIISGSPYAVTVLTQPTSPSQTCTVSNGGGTIGEANVTNVTVACKGNSYTVGGTVTGLAGMGFVVQDNSGNSLTVPPPTGNGSVPFTFTTAVASGATYAVTVLTQPADPVQVCTVTNGTGTITNANVSTVGVNCVNVGRFVFVANLSDGANGDVTAFTIDPLSGALTSVSGSPFAADTSPNGVVVDPTGQYVYVSNGASLDVSRFMLDPNGFLTLNKQFSSTSSLPRSLAIAPSGAYLYTAGFGTVATGTIFGYTVNPVSGSLTAISSEPFAFSHAQQGIAIDPTSQLVFSAGAPHFLYVNSIGSGGTLTETGGSRAQTSEGVYGVAVWPKGGSSGGYVYTTNQTTGNISAFSYDNAGNLSPVTGAPYNAGNQTRGIAIDPSGKYLYVSNYGDGTLSSFSINAQTGALTSLGADVATGNLNAVANPGPIDLKVDPSSQFLYCVSFLDGSISFFTIGSDGTLTLANTYVAAPDGPGANSTAVAVY